MPVSVPEGGSKMSIHDEAEIERLRAVNEELRAAVRRSEMQLATAMLLLSTACCNRGDRLNGEIWENRKQKLEAEYNV
jgi:hypothetical protein